MMDAKEGRVPQPRHLVILLVMLAGDPERLPAQEPATVTRETISKAWKDRQDRVRSARFAWVEHQTDTKGVITDSLPPQIARTRLAAMGIAPGEIVPPEDTTYDVPVTLHLDGEKLRVRRDIKQWSAKTKGYVTSPYITAFDGKTAKDFLPEGGPSTGWPQGLIRAQGHPVEGKAAYLAPVLMTIRGCAPNLHHYNIDEMEVTNRWSLIEGKRCLELRRQQGSSVERVWVDPGREFVIVRCLEAVREAQTVKIDVRYRRDSVCGWITQSWDYISFFPDGKVRRSARAQVTESEINLDLAPSTFDIEFPAGTRVSDKKTKQEYIVKQDNGKRTILREEIGATYEQLINSSPGEMSKSGSSSQTPWLAVVTSAIGVLALGLLIWRRARVRRSAHS